MSVIKYGNETVNPAVQVINGSNPNLLDNPWFTVNQRGKSELSCSTNNTYFVDRWSCVDCGATNFKMTNNGINICSKNKYGAIGQPIENLIAGTYTFSVIVTECNVSEYYIFIHDSSNNQMAKVTCSGTGLKQVTFTITENKQLSYFKVYANKASTTEGFTVKAVKLELGSVSTLDNDVSPNYATELLKCQRYFYRINVVNTNDYIGHVFYCNTTDARLVFPMPIELLKVPTVSYSSLSDFKISDGYATYGTPSVPTKITCVSGTKSQITVKFETDAQTIGKVRSLYGATPGAYIDFSADL